MMQVPWLDPDELGAEEWDDRHRDDIGAKESEHNSKRKCRENILADADEQYDREKDDAGAHRRCQNGELYFFAAFDCSLLRRFAHLHVAEDVLKNHNGVVDQAGESKS